MNDKTEQKINDAIQALNEVRNQYSRLNLPIIRDGLYTRAFDAGKIYISPVSYSDDRNAVNYEIELTKEEQAAIKDMVLQRIISDAEKQRAYIDDLADKVCSVLFDRN